jgi:hypothetical protein
VLKAIQIICALALAGSILVGLATTVNYMGGRSGPMLSAANRNKILLLTVGSEPKTLDPAITDTDPEGKIEQTPRTVIDKYRPSPRAGNITMTIRSGSSTFEPTPNGQTAIQSPPRTLLFQSSEF